MQWYVELKIIFFWDNRFRIQVSTWSWMSEERDQCHFLLACCVRTWECCYHEWKHSTFKRFDIKWCGFSFSRATSIKIKRVDSKMNSFAHCCSRGEKKSPFFYHRDIQIDRFTHILPKGNKIEHLWWKV